MRAQGTYRAGFGFPPTRSRPASAARWRRDAAYPFRRGSTGGMALPDSKNMTGATDRSATEPPSDRDTGEALRSIYQKTIDEQIPDEMLDLLGKLD